MKLNTLFDSDYNEESHLMADQSEKELSQVITNYCKHKFKTDEADANCFLKTSPKRASQRASRPTSMEALIHRDGQKKMGLFQSIFPVKFSPTPVCYEDLSPLLGRTA